MNFVTVASIIYRHGAIEIDCDGHTTKNIRWFKSPREARKWASDNFVHFSTMTFKPVKSCAYQKCQLTIANV